MSKVLVKGMNIPQSCYGGIGKDCDFAIKCLADGRIICSRTGQPISGYYNCRPIDCPLEEVPTPHGNLIDKEEVISVCKREICYSCNDNFAGRCTNDGNCRILKALDIIAESPTIIKAEKV